MKKLHSHGSTAGFTLIEVMIVIVIIGILASIALPGYQNSVTKANRRTAQADLLAFSQSMEKEYALQFTYANAVAGTVYPATSPQDGGTPMYNLSIAAADANSYTLRATPVGRQAGNGYLEITHLSQKRWDRNNDGDTADAEESKWD